MNVQEQIAEANYRIEERLAILTDGRRMATPAERREAIGDANKAVNEIVWREQRESELNLC